MSDVMLRTVNADTMTRVSNVFIDHYMSSANGEYVKIYLYLLRCLGDGGVDFSIAGIADRFEYTQRDVLRALSYWEKQGLLRLECTPDGSLSGICLVEPKAQTPQAAVAAQESQMTVTMEVAPFADTAVAAPLAGAQRRMSSAKPHGSLAQEPDHMYSLDEIQLLGKDMDVQEILFVTERYIGRPLSSTESNSVLSWYDYMHMSADLIEYLVEYCVENGHKSIHYMNKVAQRWVSDGISTVDEAKNSGGAYDKAYRAVTSNFGISGRNLTPPERQYLDTWTRQYGFSEDLIAEACKRTILKTGRGSFQYADRILSSWKGAKASTMEDVSRLDTAHNSQVVKFTPQKQASTQNQPKDKFHNFPERDYDYNAIQALLMKQQ